MDEVKLTLMSPASTNDLMITSIKMDYVHLRMPKSKYFAFVLVNIFLDFRIFEWFYSLYKCSGDKYNQLDDEEVQAYRNLPIDESLCKIAQFVEMCVKEVRPSCIGFFQRQLRIFAQGTYVDQGETIPQCLKSMLAEVEEEKFPIINKIVDDLKKLDLKKLTDELALIKQVVNNQWKLAFTFNDSCAFSMLEK